MARQRHLKNAPIIEALIDIRANAPQGFDPVKFSELATDLAERYPKKEPRRRFTGIFGVEEGKPFAKVPNDQVVGYFFKSEDGKAVAQFRVDGFSFSRLHPYTEWSAIFSEASRLWHLYYFTCKPEAITRVALRYINKLDIPDNMRGLSDYLTAPPKVPRSVPQTVSQFLTRVIVREADITANIIQTSGKSTKPGYIGVILDIDVFKANAKGFDEEGILSEFGQLRALKNRIFFGSITEKMSRLYE